jgi:hypothetical protein
MLTKEQIRKNLKENPDWEPEGDLTAEEWRLFDEIFDELEAAGELNIEPTGKGGKWDDDDEWDEDDDDNDADWD